MNIKDLINKFLGKDSMEKLKKENEELKTKLEERQEVINKTNAYWKKKLYAVKNNKNK